MRQTFSRVIVSTLCFLWLGLAQAVAGTAEKCDLATSLAFANRFKDNQCTCRVSATN